MNHLKKSMYISYSQIAVFDAGIDEPFNDWTDENVEQGFSCRKESVSFRVPGEDGFYEVECHVNVTNYQLNSDLARVLEVPLVVSNDKGVEIASISDSISIEAPDGKYLVSMQTVDRKIIIVLREEGAPQKLIEQKTSTHLDNH